MQMPLPQARKCLKVTGLLIQGSWGDESSWNLKLIQEDAHSEKALALQLTEWMIICLTKTVYLRWGGQPGQLAIKETDQLIISNRMEESCNNKSPSVLVGSLPDAPLGNQPNGWLVHLQYSNNSDDYELFSAMQHSLKQNQEKQKKAEDSLLALQNLNKENNNSIASALLTIYPFTPVMPALQGASVVKWTGLLVVEATILGQNSAPDLQGSTPPTFWQTC